MKDTAREGTGMKGRSVTQFYESDHDRLDGLFRSFQQLKGTVLEQAGSCFREFQEGLLRHMLWEEEILFPLFDRKAGPDAGGLTQAMKSEHAVIRTYLDRIRDQVQLRSGETDEAEGKLLEALSAHNVKEEQILYPAIDGAIDADELSHIFRSMKRSREGLLL